MILLFNNIPVTLDRKIAEFINTVKSAYGSDFYDVEGTRWKGDDLPVNSLFPKWILKEAEENPNSVTIVQIVKSYYRWLYSIDLGYGAMVPWEEIRDPAKVPEKLLLAYADHYFPGADFSENSVLNDLLPNIRMFALNSELNYFNLKGTPIAIKYLLTTLLGISDLACSVYSGSPGFLNIVGGVPDKYKPFLNEHVYPAGVVVTYSS